MKTFGKGLAVTTARPIPAALRIGDARMMRSGLASELSRSHQDSHPSRRPGTGHGFSEDRRRAVVRRRAAAAWIAKLSVPATRAREAEALRAH
jgi:hypothetical protein